MSTDPRYRDALGFLLEGGARLAGAAPRLAPQLSERSKDPDVERILEGVAYIVSQLERMIDARTDLLHQLAFDLIAPGYLSPIPALSTVELHSPVACTIPAGTELVSDPVEGTVCRFRTVYDVEASPLTIHDVRLKALRGHAELTIHFRQAAFPAVHPDRLRLLVTGELGVAATLHSWLSSCFAGAEWLDARGASRGPAPEIQSSHVGLSADDAMWASQTRGHRLELLKEYFGYPQKFLYLDLHGVVSAARRLGIDDGRFGLRIKLAVEGARELPVNADSLRLGATPIANVFPHSADPTRREGIGAEILVRPSGPLGHYDVHQVLAVRSIGPAGVRPIPLVHELDVDGATEIDAIAQLYRKRGPLGVSTWLHIEEREAPPPEDVIAIDLLATNGRLPRALRPGDLSGNLRGFEGVRVEHRFAVSASHPPPSGEDVRRALVQHMTLGFRTLASREALSDAFGLYHFGALSGGVLARELELLQGTILDLNARPKVFSLEGDSVRGVETEILIDETAFSSEGEAWLFGSVLDELLAVDSGLNVVSSVAIRSKGSGRRWVWPRRVGHRVLPGPRRAGRPEAR